MSVPQAIVHHSLHSNLPTDVNVLSWSREESLTDSSTLTPETSALLVILVTLLLTGITDTEVTAAVSMSASFWRTDFLRIDVIFVLVIWSQHRQALQTYKQQTTKSKIYLYTAYNRIRLKQKSVVFHAPNHFG